MDGFFPIEVSARNSDHVRIATCDMEGFDDAIRELLPRETAEAAFDLKPYLFIVSNPSAQTVVAYCIRFDFSHKNGPIDKQFDHCNNPTAVLTDAPGWSSYNEPLRPGDRRVVSAGAIFPLGPDHNDSDWIPAYRDYLGHQHPKGTVDLLTIGLDAVILSDGTLSGPNESDFGKNFATFVSAERETFRRIVESVDAGRSPDDVFQSLLTESGGPVTDGGRASEPSLWYAVESIGEAYGIWQRNGDEEFLKIARGILVREPFSIRHKD